MRFAACMDVPLDIIEPCGFLFTDKHLKRAGMDYRDLAVTHRFSSWRTFCEARKGTRRVAVTSSSSQKYNEFSFCPTDLLIVGQESRGLPTEVLSECDETVAIPMAVGRRSLNLAIAAAIVTTEALRQTYQLPGTFHG